MTRTTIVIPTFNRPDRIRRAVLSAVNQSYKSIEVIVVDDNGQDTEDADNTRNAIQDLIDEKKVTYYCNEINRGGSFSRNVGLENSNGDFITFLDDDDEIDASKIDKQVSRLIELGDEYGAVYTGYRKLLSGGKQYHSSEVVEGEVFIYALSRSIYVGSGSNLLVRTSLARQINGYDIDFKRNQDLEFMTRVLKQCKLAYVDEELLTIHYEIREVKRSYEEMVSIDNFYLSKFRHEIAALSQSQRKCVLSIVALERFRYSLFCNVFDGIRNLAINKVNIEMFLKYIIYALDRILNKKSYGFKVNRGKV